MNILTVNVGRWFCPYSIHSLHFREDICKFYITTKSLSTNKGICPQENVKTEARIDVVGLDFKDVAQKILRHSGVPAAHSSDFCSTSCLVLAGRRSRVAHVDVRRHRFRLAVFSRSRVLCLVGDGNGSVLYRLFLLLSTLLDGVEAVGCISSHSSGVSASI